MSAIDWEHAPEIAKPTYEELEAMCWELTEQNAELREHVRMPDEPLEIDEKDFYVRAFIKWATEEQPEVKRLEAENAELRRERDFYFQQVTENGERAHGAIDALNAKNEKLRELVRHMHTCLDHYEPGDTISCEQCPYDNETLGCDYERLMAELGIEVDV